MINYPRKKELEHIFAEQLDSKVFPVLAQIYFTSSQYTKAEKICHIGLQHDKNNMLGKYILAKIYLIDNKIIDAEKLLK